MSSKYKNSKENDSTAKRILDHQNSSSDAENEMNPQDELLDIDMIIEQFDDKLDILKKNADNYTNTIFQEALSFFHDCTSEIDMGLLFNLKLDQVLELLYLIITLLNQNLQIFELNLDSIHILNNLISTKNLENIKNQMSEGEESENELPEEQVYKNDELQNPLSDQILEEIINKKSRRIYFPITEELLFDLHSVFNNFTSQFFDNPCQVYNPLLFECFELLDNQYTLIHIFFDECENYKFPKNIQEIVKQYIETIKNIILMENIDPVILKHAFECLFNLFKEDFSLHKNFVDAGFIPICFDLMEDKNEAFPEIIIFLANISYNSDYSINQYPENYPSIFQSFLEDPESSDEVIESVLFLINSISMPSIVVRKKFLQLDNFLENLLYNLNQSYRIRKDALDVFNQLASYDRDEIDNFFTENPDFDFFIDFIDTGNQDIIKLVLSIISAVAQYVGQKEIVPDYFYNLAQSYDLLDRIYAICEEKNSTDINYEAAFLVMGEIEGTIKSRELDIEFNYEMKYDNEVSDMYVV